MLLWYGEVKDPKNTILFAPLFAPLFGCGLGLMGLGLDLCPLLRCFAVVGAAHG